MLKIKSRSNLTCRVSILFVLLVRVDEAASGLSVQIYRGRTVEGENVGYGHVKWQDSWPKRLRRGSNSLFGPLLHCARTCLPDPPNE
eukprot:1141146-Pelagomonas_calceolata.AAC.1